MGFKNVMVAPELRMACMCPVKRRGVQWRKDRFCWKWVGVLVDGVLGDGWAAVSRVLKLCKNYLHMSSRYTLSQGVGLGSKMMKVS